MWQHCWEGGDLKSLGPAPQGVLARKEKPPSRARGGDTAHTQPPRPQRLQRNIAQPRATTGKAAIRHRCDLRLVTSFFVPMVIRSIGTRRRRALLGLSQGANCRTRPAHPIRSSTIFSPFFFHDTGANMEVGDGGTTPAFRRTRGALADLSRQLAGVTVTTHLFATPNNNIQMPSSLMSPAPSPDEMIIRLRGRKKTPITWSPASETGVKKLSQFEITPPKGC